MLTMLTASSTVAACGAVRRRLNREGRKPQSYSNDRVRLTALWNHGAAFGLPVSQKTLLGGTALALLTTFHLRKKAPISAGLILGGGLSNLAERLTQGKVYDYVQFPKAPGKLKSYVYNLADFAVFLGALGLLFHREKK